MASFANTDWSVSPDALFAAFPKESKVIFIKAEALRGKSINPKAGKSKELGVCPAQPQHM